jgi:hypothetical protein
MCFSNPLAARMVDVSEPREGPAGKDQLTILEYYTGVFLLQSSTV